MADERPQVTEEEAAKPPVRDSGPVEGVRGNREVPPTSNAEPEALLAERDQLLDDLKRVAADFDNYRKRAARERATVYAQANERLVKELIPVLDDLGRALEAAGEAAKRPVRDSGPVE